MAKEKKEATTAESTEKKTTRKTTAKTTTKTAAKTTKAAAKTTKTTKKTAKAAAEVPAVEEVLAAPAVEEVSAAPVVEEVPAAPAAEAVPVAEEAQETVDYSPRRSIAFIGSECYPFVKTGGLADVMSALPKALVKQNCDVRVIIPRYKCIPQKFQDMMEYKGSFVMDLCSDGRTYYVGIMEMIMDGVVYDFIDNEEFFGWGKPYTDLYIDIPKYCFFSKAALAALNFMDWVPNIIHCHDWQAALAPVYLRTLFADTNIGGAKTIFTIHNLRFQGQSDMAYMKYWSGLPEHLFNIDVLKENYEGANMMKGGLAYSDIITTVSETYAWEIQTEYYGEGLDAHLRHHSGKLIGIVNGIDYDIWNTTTDKLLAENYDVNDILEKKLLNKAALQEELGLEQNTDKFVIGLISRLTNQKGLDLINAI
ncbi:MAG: glycogen synthase, partial [Blautia sp.]|nr:glycogen synthase [Blautia sp.]